MRFRATLADRGSGFALVATLDKLLTTSRCALDCVSLAMYTSLRGRERQCLERLGNAEDAEDAPRQPAPVCRVSAISPCARAVVLLRALLGAGGKVGAEGAVLEPSVNQRIDDRARPLGMAWDVSTPSTGLRAPCEVRIRTLLYGSVSCGQACVKDGGVPS